ncbi:sigma-70 family RNA polymerase sigma factor [Pseudomonas sp. NPDC088890]|uniref:sigma-70 family RNA polymerase sigma factor n=1 Tax=Pseudomonas sp. NPDC088890 TaxID=3364458 RepID=UPI00384F5752
MSAADSPSPYPLEVLYSEHHGWLFNWLRRKLRCSHSAADLVQDTFVRILASRDALLGMREPRAYLSTTARRLLIDKARRQQIEDAYLAELALTAQVLDGHQSPERILLTLEALEQIAFLLEGLHPKARQAFVDYYLDELSQTQIAERLQISSRMVRKYLAQALVHCHQALDYDAP